MKCRGGSRTAPFMGMRYFIKTFGCQMNISDSERIAGFLESLPHPNPLLSKERGLELAKDINEADLVIFNTCGIRQAAENRAQSLIHTLRKARPEAKIILTGCLANRKDVRQRLKNKVDLFCEIKNVASMLYKVLSKNTEKIHDTSYMIHDNFPSNCNYLKTIPKHTNKHTALVPVMTGCNNFCAYCVVPYARGREVSRPADEIVSEIKQLIKNGYREIILLGQNVNSYHGTCNIKHETTTINFSALIRKIEKIPGRFWIRFVSSHPKDFSPELIELIAKSKKVCEHIHLPLQAGSDKILASMNRRYTQKYYLDLIKKIRTAFKKYKPNTPYSLTSDIIVGFPGETKKQFLESATVMEKVKYDMVYFGQFSPRPGTVAWKMKDNVTRTEKVRREKHLNEILAKTNFQNNKKYVGKVIEVLIEQEKDGSYFGKTRTWKNIKMTITNYHPELAKGHGSPIGKIVKVKIIKANLWNLEGIIELKANSQERSF